MRSLLMEFLLALGLPRAVRHHGQERGGYVEQRSGDGLVRRGHGYGRPIETAASETFIIRRFGSGDALNPWCS
jgi:hypothetical protein